MGVSRLAWRGNSGSHKDTSKKVTVAIPEPVAIPQPTEPEIVPVETVLPEIVPLEVIPQEPILTGLESMEEDMIELRPIVIVIPTLDQARAEKIADLALLSAGCDARVVIVSGPARGFTKTVNDGIRQTVDEDICIMNDDIIDFPDNWLAHLALKLRSNPHFGIIGPSGKSSTSPASHGRPGMKGIEECQQLSYWCVLLKREMIDRIGILDERFIHYCSDNEYNVRARKNGWKVIWMRSVYVDHKHHGSGLRTNWANQDKAMLKKVLG